MATADVRIAVASDAEGIATLQIDWWRAAYATVLPAAVLGVDPAVLAAAWAERIADGTVLLATEGSATGRVRGDRRSRGADHRRTGGNRRRARCPPALEPPGARRPVDRHGRRPAQGARCDCRGVVGARGRPDDLGVRRRDRLDRAGRQAGARHRRGHSRRGPVSGQPGPGDDLSAHGASWTPERSRTTCADRCGGHRCVSRCSAGLRGRRAADRLKGNAERSSRRGSNGRLGWIERSSRPMDAERVVIRPDLCSARTDRRSR